MIYDKYERILNYYFTPLICFVILAFLDRISGSAFVYLVEVLIIVTGILSSIRNYQLFGKTFFIILFFVSILSLFTKTTVSKNKEKYTINDFTPSNIQVSLSDRKVRPEGLNISNHNQGRTNPCYTCKGTGVVECTWCDGTGKNTFYDKLTPFYKTLSSPKCAVCDGKRVVTCPQCHGDKYF